MAPLRLVQLDTALEDRGGQRQAELLLRGLAARGHAQAVLCPPEGGLARRVLGLPGARLARSAEELPGPGALLLHPCAPGPHPATAWQAARLLRAWPGALPVAQTPHAHGLWLAAGVRPVVHRRVDFPPRGPLGRWKLGQARAFVAVSAAVARVLYAAGVPPDRVHVVPDGVEPLPSAAPAALGEGAVVLAVAALVDHKDPLTLARAAEWLAARGVSARVVVAGEGPLRPQLQGLELLGWRADVPALLARAQVFVHSAKLEGFGQAVVEAMLAGVPVVACAAGGVPEALGDTGLLVPPQDPAALGAALERALRGDHPPVELAQARARERFGVARMVAQTEGVYVACASAG